ncbi:MAG: patatin-like phospholipase family protein [Planctomycetota bacterium]
MSIRGKLKWLFFGVLGVLLIEGALVACAILGGMTRPDGVPEGVEAPLPWGAMEPLVQPELTSDLQQSIADSILSESAEEFDPDGDGVRTYDLLALSGGGSKGAFGAGFLSGWSTTGQRPRFKVVTGVSAGALQATAAFLGPTYDHLLREIFTGHENKDIYTGRSWLRIPASDSVYDSAPLQGLIRKYMTADVMADVAAEYAKGRRLFIGTLNMDTGDFVIWDMGKVASSGRPDALEHYQNILMASSAAQVVFPPVYFDVDVDGATYGEMHGDGATYTQAFFRGFLVDFDDALEDTGLDVVGTEANLYVLINGKLTPNGQRKNATPRAISIAGATMEHLLQMRAEASLFRMYVLARRNGVSFNIAAIPNDFMPDVHMLDFTADSAGRLFDAGYKLASQGYQWMDAPPNLDKDELFDHADIEPPAGRVGNDLSGDEPQSQEPTGPGPP